jgi:parallel beta-helix repeat protein
MRRKSRKKYSFKKKDLLLILFLIVAIAAIASFFVYTIAPQFIRMPSSFPVFPSTTPRGDLEVNMVSYPPSINLLEPFKVKAEVKCNVPSCGYVTATLDPNGGGSDYKDPVSLVEDTWDYVIYEVLPDEPKTRIVSHQGREYTEIIPGRNMVHPTRIGGDPGIFGIRIRSLNPEERKVGSIEIVSKEVKTLRIPNLRPYQEFIPPSMDFEGWEEFGFNEPNELYLDDRPYPERDYEYSNGFLNGYGISDVIVYPYKYNPSTEELSIYSFEVKIAREAGPPSPNYKGPDQKSLQTAGVKNPNIARSYPNSKPMLYQASFIVNPADDYEYVIITVGKFEELESVQKLLEHRKLGGVTATLVTVEDIEKEKAYDLGGAIPKFYGDKYPNPEFFGKKEKVRNFIRDAFLRWGAKYFLLLGDADSIGTVKENEEEMIPMLRFQAHSPTDQFYMGLEGTCDGVNNNGIYGERKYIPETGEYVEEADYFSEVFVGRVSADSKEEADNFIKKLIRYETNMPHTSEINDLLFSTEYEFLTGTWFGDRKDDAYEGTYYGNQPTPGIYDVTKMYEKIWKWTEQDAIDQINKNPFLINVMQHANDLGLLKLGWEDFDKLENDGSILYSLGCISGDVVGSGEHTPGIDDIAEYFMLSPGGTVAYMGPSVISGGEGEWIDAWLFEGMFHERLPTISEAFFFAKYNSFYSPWFNYLGDPKMPGYYSSKPVIASGKGYPPEAKDHTPASELFPYFTDEDNPQELGVMNQGDSKVIEWTVTPTGPPITHEFWVEVSSPSLQAKSNSFFLTTQIPPKDYDKDGFISQDCEPFNPQVNPSAKEICDAVDNNCNTLVDEDDMETDKDGDSYSYCDLDCDDGDKDINPGEAEDCGDGIDNDCDGFIDCWDRNCKSYTGPPEDCSQYHPECGPKPHDDCEYRQNTVMDKGTYYFSGAIDIFDGVHLDCNGAKIISTSGSTFNIEGDDIIIENCEIEGGEGQAFGKLYFHNNIIIRNNILKHYTTAIQIPSYAGNNYYLIEGNTIRNAQVGIKMEEVSVNIKNNKFYQCATGIDVMQATSCLIENNQFDSMGKGILIRNTLDGCTIKGNTFTEINKHKELPSAAIMAEYVPGVQILGNTFDRISDGIYIDDSPDSLIDGNTFRNQFDSTDFGGAGIFIDESDVLGGDHITISNNVFENNLRNIYVSSDNNIIENNDFKDGGTIMLIKYHSDLPEKNIIRNNDFYELSPVGKYPNSPTIRHIISIYDAIDTEIYGNTFTNKLYPELMASIKLGGDKGTQLHDNTFDSEGFFKEGFSLQVSSATDNAEIHNNNFLTPIEITLFTGNNNWDGNYWKVYDSPSEGCEDLNNDGECDSPLILKDNSDNHPKTHLIGTQINHPPEPTLIVPKDKASTGTLDVEFKFSVKDQDNDPYSFTLYEKKGSVPGEEDAIYQGSASTPKEFTYLLKDLKEGDEYFWFVRTSDGKQFQDSETRSFVASLSNCTYPSEGMKITESTTICSGTYNFVNGFSIEAPGIKVDCEDNTVFIGPGHIFGGGAGIIADDVVMENCEFRKYGTGISVSGNNVILTKNTACETPGFYDITVSGSASTTGQGNTCDKAYQFTCDFPC